MAFKFKILSVGTYPQGRPLDSYVNVLSKYGSVEIITSRTKFDLDASTILVLPSSGGVDYDLECFKEYWYDVPFPMSTLNNILRLYKTALYSRLDSNQRVMAFGSASYYVASYFEIKVTEEKNENEVSYNFTINGEKSAVTSSPQAFLSLPPIEDVVDAIEAFLFGGDNNDNDEDRKDPEPTSPELEPVLVGSQKPVYRAIRQIRP